MALLRQRKECVGIGRALALTPPHASQDEEGAIVMLKRHLRQQRTVDEYGRNIKQLAGRAQSLLSAGHPEGYVCLLGWHGWWWASGPRRERGDRSAQGQRSLFCFIPWVVSKSHTR